MIDNIIFSCLTDNMLHLPGRHDVGGWEGGALEHSLQGPQGDKRCSVPSSIWLTRFKTSVHIVVITAFTEIMN